MIQLMETHYTIKCTEGELRTLVKAVSDFDINASDLLDNEKNVLLDFRKRYNFMTASGGAVGGLVGEPPRAGELGFKLRDHDC